MKKVILLLGMLFFSFLGFAQVNISPSREDEPFWERIYTLPDSCNRTYDIATNAQGDIFVATNKGLYKSSDYAETWESVWQEGDRYCTALDIAPNGRICVGSNTDHLCFSDDNGDTWESVSIPHGGGGCTAYRVKYFGNDTLFALPTSLGSGAYVDYSFDGGSTWNFSRIGNWALDYATDVAMSKNKMFYVCLCYKGNKGIEECIVKGGVYKSKDCMEWDDAGISTVDNCFSVISSSPYSELIILGDFAPLYSHSNNKFNKADNIQLMPVYGCVFIENETIVTTNKFETTVSFDGGNSFTTITDQNGGNRIVVGKDGHLYSTFYTNNAKLSRSVNPVDDLLKVNEQAAHDEITVYPNPATDGINVFSESSHIELKVYSSNGTMMESREGDNSYTIDVSGYSKGIYLFQITSNGKITTHKIIVK